MAAVLPPVARVLVYATAALWAVAELRQGMNTRPEARQADRGSRLVVRLSAVAGVVGATLVDHVKGADIRPTTVPVWSGLVVLWCGVALRLWSFRTLGRYFTFTVQTSPDQPVITAGPYGVVRHPSYAAILLAVIGIGLLLTNWLSLVVLVAGTACGLAFRIRVEERALLRDIGEPYRRYAETHKRLIPFVW